MQANNSKPEMQISSFSLGRRGFLAGGAAAAVTIAASTVAEASVPDDNHDLMLIDEDLHDELEEEACKLDGQMLAIVKHPDRPPPGEIMLADVFDRKRLDDVYWSDNPTRHFCGAGGVDEIDRFFNSRIIHAEVRARSRPEEVHHPAALRADWLRARQALQDRIDALDAFDARSGLDALEAQSVALWTKIWSIEERIFATPCLSVRDIRVKLRMMDRWLPDNGDDEGPVKHLRAVLNSMRDFANSHSCPSAASGQLVSGAA